MAVAAVCFALLRLVLGPDADAGWVVRAGGGYALAEIAYWLWDRRRLIEVRIVEGETGALTRLRMRRASGRIAECDPRRVSRVLIVRDNVNADSAALRLSLGRGRLSFGRPGRPPSPAAWRAACPRAAVESRGARWGMPGIPD